MTKEKSFSSDKAVYPQEIEVWYAIPSIRREIAIEMKKRGLAQKKIASILGITGAAVSQYFSKKRAAEIKFDKSLKKEVSKSVDRILENNELFMQEVQRILELPEIRTQLCKIHEQCGGACTECKICWHGM